MQIRLPIFANGKPKPGDSFQWEDRTFVFTEGLPSSADEIQIGADCSETARNILAKVNELFPLEK